MARHCKLVLLLSLLLGVPSVAHASFITINPNDYPLGTDLSTMFDGLTMSRLTNAGTTYNPVASAVYAIPSYHTDPALSIGGRSYYTFGYETCRVGLSGCLYDVLELLFSEPTSFVQINSRGWSDGAGFLAYDSAGNRLGASFFNNAIISNVTQFGGGAGFSETLTLARGQADIARVVYAGMVGSTTPTQITYRVPEPSALLVLSLGGALLFVRRRKKA